MRRNIRLAAIGLALAITSTACAAGAATTPSGPAGEVIRIGFANMDTGTTSFPAVVDSAEAAAEYVNETQGGIGGRPIELVVCDMKNDAQAAQECGQQFANDDSISFALLSATLNGGPFYEAMRAAGKPVLGGLAVVPADYSPEGVSFYYPSASYYTTLTKYLQSLDPQRVSVVYETTAATTAGAETIKNGLTAAGVEVVTASIQPGAADVTAAVASARIDEADATLLLASGACPKLVSAMRSLGVTSRRTIIGTACATAETISSAAADYEGWNYFATFELGATGDRGGADVSTFLAGYEEHGPGDAPGTWAEVGWGLVLTAAQVFEGVDEITPASAGTAITGYTGPVVLGPDEVSCPGPAEYPSTCVEGGTVYTITGGNIVASS